MAAGFGAYRADVKAADVFPGADRFGPLEGTPPAIAAYRGGAIAGYVFETTDIGYSGKPIRILAGIDRDGTITGAKVIEHHEPILLVGISPDKLFEFVGRHAGRNIIDMSREVTSKEVDVISGATVTAVVINDGIMRTALAVAKSRGLAGFPAPGARTGGTAAAPAVRTVLADIPFVKTEWTTMLGDGSIRRLHLLNREVDEAFAKIGVGSPEPYGRAGVPDEDFIDLYAGLFSIETHRTVTCRRQRLQSARLVACAGAERPHSSIEGRLQLPRFWICTRRNFRSLPARAGRSNNSFQG